MKKFIYITGPQGSGKTILANSIKGALIIDWDTYRNANNHLPLFEAVNGNLCYHDTVVVVSQQRCNHFITKQVKQLCHQNVKILDIKLK